MLSATAKNPESPLILVTGATGYIGGRLVPRLLELGYRVRCIVREPARLQGRPWQHAVQIMPGNLLEKEGLDAAMAGVSVAYYLVHSLAEGPNFHRSDLVAAANFGRAARMAGVTRIIYLGGLALPDTALSEHLRSRQETGDALRQSGVAVTEFRAGVIVGSGSASFEMIRYLTERVPIMICPRWVYTRAQPIGIGDVLDYLTAALRVPESSGRIIEIGGSEIVTYREMMSIYAAIRGLRRWMVAVPILSSRLSSYWVHLVTPIPATIARPLVDGLRNENIVRDFSARSLFPGIEPLGYRTAAEHALAELQAGNIESAWSDALSTTPSGLPLVVLATQRGMILEHRQRLISASPADVYSIITGLGGSRGWLYMNWAWELRGLLDRLFGGVGLRRGRRDPDRLRVGDALDFWRVEAVEAEHILTLRAEMKVPGKAWLQFQIRADEKHKTLLTQTAFFAPKGLWGVMYWYLLYPIHRLIFSGMIQRIAEYAEDADEVRRYGPAALRKH